MNAPAVDEISRVFALQQANRSAVARQTAAERVARLETLAKDAQVRVVNHPSSDPMFWDRVDTLTRRKPGDPNPFVTPGIFPTWLQSLRAEANEQLEQERAAKAKQ